MRHSQRGSKKDAHESIRLGNRDMAITAPSAIGSIKLGSFFLILPTRVFTGQPMRAEQHISSLGAVKYRVAFYCARCARFNLSRAAI